MVPCTELNLEVNPVLHSMAALRIYPGTHQPSYWASDHLVSSDDPMVSMSTKPLVYAMKQAHGFTWRIGPCVPLLVDRVTVYCRSRKMESFL